VRFGHQKGCAIADHRDRPLLGMPRERQPDYDAKKCDEISRLMRPLRDVRGGQSIRCRTPAL